MLENLITGLVTSESAWDVFMGRTLEQLNLLLTAPVHEPELIWLLIPLLFTLVVMTFYFGMYRREELGWNTALGNSIVLMFITLDLFRQIYHYTPVPDMDNFLNYPIQTVLVIVIFTEAMILALFAFYHVLPRKVMYFIASPLPVNLQAYIIMSIVYTRFTPNWYMLSAAILAFIILWCTTQIIKIIERSLVHRIHISKIEEAQRLRKEAKKAKKKMQQLKGEPREDAEQIMHEKIVEAQRLEQSVLAAENLETGEADLDDLLKELKERQEKSWKFWKQKDWWKFWEV